MKKKNKLPSKNVIEEALLKKALGYDCDEVVEEYIVDEDGNARLSKKKVTKKHIAPDIPAAKVLLEHYSTAEQSKYENMTDEELRQEKLNLIKLLQKEGENCGD